jgi:hypothetical protein
MLLFDHETDPKHERPKNTPEFEQTMIEHLVRLTEENRAPPEQLAGPGLGNPDSLGSVQEYPQASPRRDADRTVLPRAGSPVSWAARRRLCGTFGLPAKLLSFAIPFQSLLMRFNPVSNRPPIP